MMLPHLNFSKHGNWFNWNCDAINRVIENMLIAKLCVSYRGRRPCGWSPHTRLQVHRPRDTGHGTSLPDRRGCRDTHCGEHTPVCSWAEFRYILAGRHRLRYLSGFCTGRKAHRGQEGRGWEEQEVWWEPQSLKKYNSVLRLTTSTSLAMIVEIYQWF